MDTELWNYSADAGILELLGALCPTGNVICMDVITTLSPH